MIDDQQKNNNSSPLSEAERSLTRRKKTYRRGQSVLTAYCIFGWGEIKGDRCAKETEIWIQRNLYTGYLSLKDVESMLTEIAEILKIETDRN